MRVTKVKIKLADRGDPHEQLLGFASFVLDGEFCVRDCKLIQGRDGRVVVAMPSRKLCDRCPGCGAKNILVARFCNRCGAALAANRAAVGDDGHPKLYADTVHPVSPAGREIVATAVVAAYLDELDARHGRHAMAS